MSDETALFEGAISYEDELPLTWIGQSKLPRPFDATRLAETNQRTLGTIAQLEERPAVTDDPGQPEQELSRLHAKLDALIAVVGVVLPRFLSLPPPTRLHLSWRGVIWNAVAEPPPVGETGYVEIYLHAALLKVLRLPARIVRVDGSRVRADFAEGGGSCQQALE